MHASGPEAPIRQHEARMAEASHLAPSLGARLVIWGGMPAVPAKPRWRAVPLVRIRSH